VGLYVAKCYFLRRQPLDKLAESGRWDKAGYLATALLSVAIAAYGLYGLSAEVSEASAAEPSMKYQGDNTQSVSPTPMSREELQTRIQELEEDLITLSRYPPTPARDKKIAAFEDELRILKETLESLSSDSAHPMATQPVINRINGDFVNPDQTIETKVQPHGEKAGSTVSLKPAMKTTESSFEGFVAATLSLATHAMICWILIIVVELSTLILTHHQYLKTRL
jgi:hypothetical protein